MRQGKPPNDLKKYFSSKYSSILGFLKRSTIACLNVNMFSPDSYTHFILIVTIYKGIRFRGGEMFALD